MVSIDALLGSLTLEQVGEDRYRASNADTGHGVVFGGQLMAQAIVAGLAGHEGKTVKTLHTVFARAGKPEEPVEVAVDRMHSGRAFASSTVTISQGDRLCTRSTVLLTADEPDEHGQRGVVVNTASIAGIEGQTGQLAYAAAKAAILGMTLPLARALGAVGVRVCAIAPGTMGTPIMLSVPEELKANLTRSIVFPKRMGRPEEFALLVESIARNPYLNGENIRLDGALRFPPK